jgi:hypothetical protein
LTCIVLAGRAPRVARLSEQPHVERGEQPKDLLELGSAVPGLQPSDPGARDACTIGQLALSPTELSSGLAHQ